MIVNKNLNYLKEFLKIDLKTIIKAVVKGEIKTKEYRIKADFIEDGVSLLVTDLKGEEVFFRGLIYDLKTTMVRICNSFETDLGKFVVEQSGDKYIVWERVYDERTDRIREVVVYKSEDPRKVVEFIEKKLEGLK
ncbi:MAG: hypothetical protein DRH17_13750 [Deltaproteobacteria bacterium]|nr:MAG: hypothetical protein DRH17_13750 [Deltaproteobacteria bacterium]